MPGALRPYRVTYKNGNTRTVYAYNVADARKEATRGLYGNAGPVESVDSTEANYGRASSPSSMAGNNPLQNRKPPRTWSVKFRDGHSFAVGGKDKTAARRIALAEHAAIHESEDSRRTDGFSSGRPTAEPESLTEIGR